MKHHMKKPIQMKLTISFLNLFCFGNDHKAAVIMYLQGWGGGYLLKSLKNLEPLHLQCSKILIPSLKDGKILAPTTTRLFKVSP